LLLYLLHFTLYAFYRCPHGGVRVFMLRAIDGSARSIDRAAQSSDPSFAQASVDRATIDRSRCAIDGSLDCAAQSKDRPLPKWNWHNSKKCLSIIPGILFWYISGFVCFKIMNISDTCSITDDSLH